MIHYTLTTDHSRESPRGEVADTAIDALLPLLRGCCSMAQAMKTAASKQSTHIYGKMFLCKEHFDASGELHGE